MSSFAESLLESSELLTEEQKLAQKEEVKNLLKKEEEEKKREERKKRKQEKLPWWGWVLVMVGGVALIALITWWFIDAQQNYGCVAGSGCVKGTGKQSKKKCEESCADEGQFVYRCNQIGQCERLSTGQGVTLENCKKNCRPLFFLSSLADPGNYMGRGQCARISLQMLNFFGGKKVLLTFPDAPTGFDPSDSTFFPMTSRIQVLEVNQISGSQTSLGFLSVASAPIPPFREDQLVAVVSEQVGGYLSFTIKYNKDRDALVFSSNVGGTTAYLYSSKVIGGDCFNEPWLVAMPHNPENVNSLPFQELIGGFFELDIPNLASA